MPIRNEQTLQKIYNCEVASNLLRTKVVTQDKTAAFAQVWTLINTATALNATMAATSNWTDLP